MTVALPHAPVARGPKSGRQGVQESPGLYGLLQRSIPELSKAMPAVGGNAEQLVRDVWTATKLQPELLKAVPDTVVGAAMTCAQLGLRPNVPSLGHAWILPFREHKTDLVKARLIIGWKGYKTLAYRGGNVTLVEGHLVHAQDKLTVEYGLSPDLTHVPHRDGDRGPVTDYYVVVRFRAGQASFFHMTRREVESHRDKYAMARVWDKETKTRKVIGPWVNHFDGMALKTCFLKLAKWLPVEAMSLEQALACDGGFRDDLSPEGIMSPEFPEEPDYIDAECEETTDDN